jgi:heme O synthase-like polyprenyltransferase
MTTTAILVSRLQSHSGTRLAARLPDFVTLTKPRVMALAVLIALVGMIIAPGLGVLIVLVLTAGTLWVMTTINHNMMPPAELMNLHMQH